MDRLLRIVTALVVATLALALASCGSQDTTEQAADADADAAPRSSAPAATPSTSASSTPGSSEPTVDDVPSNLDFRATTVGGETFDGASVAGRPVLLWFWAPWCPTCRGQIPQVQELATDNGSALTVLGVGSLDSADAIADFAGDVDEITHLEDVDGELYRRFDITEQSSFVLLDAEGEVAFQTGYGGSDALADEVAAVVG